MTSAAFRTRPGRRGLLVGLLVGGIVCPQGLDAQHRETNAVKEAQGTGIPTGFFLEPSVQFTESYDDNLFLTPDAERQSDYFMRVTPGILSGYRSARVLFTGGYNFDAERYTDHPDLETLRARQNVTFDLTTLATQRFIFAVNAGYMDTTTPSDLNQASGLILGRARAERIGARPSFTYRVSQNGRIKAEYETAYDRLEGDLGEAELPEGEAAHEDLTGFTNTGTFEYRHQVTERTFVTTDYAIRDLRFNGSRMAGPSHVFTAGVGYALSPMTTLTLRAGPRLSSQYADTVVPVPLAPEAPAVPGVAPPAGVPDAAAPVIERSVVPEWSIALRRDGRRSTVDLTWSRTQTTAIGQPDFVDTNAVALDVLLRPASAVELKVNPSFFRDALAGAETRVYRLALGMTVWLGKRFAIVSQYRYGYQEGLNAAGLGSPIPIIRQNVVSIGVLATARRRTAPQEPGRRPDGPSARPPEPGSRPQEPGSGPQEPGTGPQERR